MLTQQKEEVMHKSRKMTTVMKTEKGLKKKEDFLCWQVGNLDISTKKPHTSKTVVGYSKKAKQAIFYFFQTIFLYKFLS